MASPADLDAQSDTCALDENSVLQVKVILLRGQPKAALTGAHRRDLGN